MIKKSIYMIILSAVIIGCNGVEKKAEIMYQEANELFEKGDLLAARIKVDSIKIKYKKAYEVRKKANMLKKNIILAEQKKNINFIKTELEDIKENLSNEKKKFIFQKDSKYQKQGTYILPRFDITKRQNQTYLEFRVSEEGKIYLISHYAGRKNIKHNEVKAIATDNTFVNISNPIYATYSDNLQGNGESCSYNLGIKNDFISFLLSHLNEDINIELIGKGTYKYKLSNDDKKAIANTFQLSNMLGKLYLLNKEEKIANEKLEFIHNN